MPPKIIGRYSRFPVELTRAQNGNVRMRLKQSSRGSYDVTVNNDGKVPAAAQTGSTIQNPNGMSMRTPQLSKDLVVRYLGHSVKIYTIPKDMAVPSGLVLLLDDKKHFSLQPRQEMAKEELDSKLQQFIDGLVSETKQTWIARNVTGSSSSQGKPSASSGSK